MDRAWLVDGDQAHSRRHRADDHGWDDGDAEAGGDEAEPGGPVADGVGDVRLGEMGPGAERRVGAADVPGDPGLALELGDVDGSAAGEPVLGRDGDEQAALENDAVTFAAVDVRDDRARSSSCTERRPMRPWRSATGRNASGMSSPREGCCQRTSASTPVTAAEARSTLGW